MRGIRWLGVAGLWGVVSLGVGVGVASAQTCPPLPACAPDTTLPPGPSTTLPGATTTTAPATTTTAPATTTTAPATTTTAPATTTTAPATTTTAPATTTTAPATTTTAVGGGGPPATVSGDAVGMASDTGTLFRDTAIAVIAALIPLALAVLLAKKALPWARGLLVGR